MVVGRGTGNTLRPSPSVLTQEAWLLQWWRAEQALIPQNMSQRTGKAFQFMFQVRVGGCRVGVGRMSSNPHSEGDLWEGEDSQCEIHVLN